MDRLDTLAVLARETGDDGLGQELAAEDHAVPSIRVLGAVAIRTDRLCLGAAPARLEGRIALDEVLNRFPEWEIDIDNTRRAPTSTVRGWDSMPASVG